jgi:uncharacterized membrane protein
MRALWPWLTLVGLGMYHGVNPAMDWLFAAALGLHRRRRSVVVQSLIPIAIGHLLSIAAVAEAVWVLGVVIDRPQLVMVAGCGLILWALYHLAFGSRHRAHRHAGRARRTHGVVLSNGERSRRWANALSGVDPALLFG